MKELLKEWRTILFYVVMLTVLGYIIKNAPPPKELDRTWQDGHAYLYSHGTPRVYLHDPDCPCLKK